VRRSNARSLSHNDAHETAWSVIVPSHNESHDNSPVTARNTPTVASDQNDTTSIAVIVTLTTA
jgi:hypothetical protein